MSERTVRVLFFEGCPGHRPAVESVRRVAAELGLPVRVEEVEVRDPADAERLRFLGSPTVQVNGFDVEPAARGRTEFAFGCRTYHGSPIPPEPLIRAALGGTGGAGGEPDAGSGSCRCCHHEREGRP